MNKSTKAFHPTALWSFISSGNHPLKSERSESLTITILIFPNPKMIH